VSAFDAWAIRGIPDAAARLVAMPSLAAQSVCRGRSGPALLGFTAPPLMAEYRCAEAVPGLCRALVASRPLSARAARFGRATPQFAD